ncbi:MAG: HlyD family efflux transporter periplasmic adaptor subunit [Planctomycetes bacterium]|nr:HlyD family efflux transporter periplasmic adaptor subunit [Planctomycetota bacterium]
MFVAVALVALLVYSQHRDEPLHVSGIIEAHEIRLGSRVGGRVHRVLVDEGQAVKAGEVLVELEPFQLNELLAQAASQLAQVSATRDKIKVGFRVEEVAQAKAHHDQLAATVEKLVNGPRKEDISAAKSQLELAQAQLSLSMLKHRRTEELFAKKTTTQEEMDQANTELRVARATVDSQREGLLKLENGTRPEELAEAKAQLEEARQIWLLRQNGSRVEEIAEAEAAVESASAAMKAIQRQLDELAIKAPADGKVEAIDLRPGDLVGANAPVISVMDLSQLWVRAYVPENRLSLKVGDSVKISVDSFPGELFAATITFVSRQAEFTPGNVQTPEERSKQVFRIKVTLEAAGGDRLRPGMAADVWLGERG